MSDIVGRVVVEGTARPVPGVTVTAWVRGEATRGRTAARRRRLADTVTDAAGAFRLRVDVEEDQAVEVEATREGSRRRLAAETLRTVRRREDVTLSVPVEERPAPAPVPVPAAVPDEDQDDDDVAAEIAARRMTDVRRERLRVLVHEQTVRHVETARRRVARRGDAVAAFLRPRRDDGVDPIETAEDRDERVRAPWSRAADRLDGRHAAASVSVDEAFADRLTSSGDLSAAELATVLGSSVTGLVGRTRLDVLRDVCEAHRPAHDGCFTESEESPDTEPPGDQTAAPEPEPAQPDDGVPPTQAELSGQVATGLAALLGDLAVGVPAPGTQPTLGDVQTGIDGLTLRTGPADAPAVYDFHRLHLALEHVWEDLYDTEVVAIAARLYDHFVEAGVDPNIVRDAVDGGSAGGGNDSGPPLPPPHADLRVAELFDVTPSLWNALPKAFQDALIDIATQINKKEEAAAKSLAAAQAMLRAIGVTMDLSALDDPMTAEKYNLLRRGERLLRYAKSCVDGKAPDSSVYDELHPMLEALRKAKEKPYAFRIFAAPELRRGGARSVNFGIVTTYRQRWTPTAYQAGELVKTVPLAPKESRRFTKRTVVRRSRSEKEASSHLSSRRTETSDTARSESEIVAKALTKTNFALAAQGGVNVGLAHVSGSTNAGRDASTESAETKREFREAIVKSAQEYKSERSMEINVSESVEATDEESGEIVNPNDELTVTYLFYQLQRRYRVVEELHRVTPVVLVAQEFPNPADIDEDWAVRHDWILRRVILDDSFVPALDYLSTRVVGDESALAVLHQTLEQQRMLTDSLGHQLGETRAQLARRYASLESEIRARADAIAQEDAEGFLADTGDFLFGEKGASPEAQQVREDAARNAYDRAAREERDLVARLERESAALTQATQAYADALSKHLNRRTQISRLLVHLKDNIVHYMQAIWAHEPPDQRFLRLQDAKVPVLDGELTFSFEPDPDGLPQPPYWFQPLRLKAHCSTPPTPGETVALAEVADIDDLLGFEGNYMIFPLRRGNTLTDFMAFPYVDAATGGVRDPDAAGSWTLDELADYVCCLRHTLKPSEFNRRLPGLLKVYAHLAARPNPNGEEIVVPTDSVFIEALPGAHPLLEDFKLVHRGIDARRAAAELRRTELENLRYASRLVGGDLADPDFEKQVLVQGDVDPDVET